MELQLNVRSLLENVQFPGDDDVTYSIAVCGANERKRLVSVYKGATAESRLAAAIEIQRTWRGHRLRKRLKNILERFLLPDDSVPRVPENTSRDVSHDVSHDISHDTDTRTLVQNSCLSANIKLWSQDIGRSHDKSPDRSHDGPSLLKQTRSLVINKRKLSNYSPIAMSRDSRVTKNRQWTPQTAAVAIQRTWRKYSDIKVFKYYKELLHLHSSKCDPNRILKCIIPAESRLIDNASGTFVRFRLGGVTFPPTIFFKIFTHRSVVDMCSFSPRDYTAMSERKMLCKDVHNNKDSRAIPTDKEKWYKRIENNGWRPLSDKPAFSVDAFICSNVKKSIPFHYNKHQRRQDIEVLRKRKKIQWMKQMYKDGMDQGDVLVPHCVTPNDPRLHPITITPPSDHLYNRDIDELLQWTKELDYDNYISYWGELATSYASDIEHV